MKFKYTALNEENKQMTGVLEAESIDVAKGELHKMNLAILVINNISEEEYQREKIKEEKEMEKEGIKMYKFVAIDTKKKEVNGTIDAKDPYSAFKRLTINYHFKVKLIYPEQATDDEKKTWEAAFEKNVGKWREQLEEEGVDVEKATKAAERNKELAENEDEIDQKVVEEIDQFIINTKRVLTTHNYQFSASFLAEIQKVLGELERIRTSNNVKHITEICNQLYELVSHPDQMVDDHPNQSEYSEILDSMKNSGFVRSQFDIESKALGLNKIKHHFKRILKRIGGSEEDDGEEGKAPTKFQKFVRKIAKKTSKKKKKGDEEELSENRVGFFSVLKIAIAYITAPSPILRQTRKQELIKSFSRWHQGVTKTLVFYRIKATIKKTGKMRKWDVGGLFVEIDGFVSWLLAFYLFYFLLVDFSLEKGVGLPRGFVIQTLKSNLVVNIAICLIFAHFILKIKNEFFHKGFFGSIFLFSFGLAFYLLLIINF